jgi:hypothetical protein
MLGFSVAAWGIYQATSWWERAASGSAIFGFAPLIPYWAAAHAAVAQATPHEVSPSTRSATPSC